MFNVCVLIEVGSAGYQEPSRLSVHNQGAAETVQQVGHKRQSNGIVNAFLGMLQKYLVELKFSNAIFRRDSNLCSYKHSDFLLYFLTSLLYIN